MPVTRSFSARASLKTLVVIMNSLGAHVAAKLGHFGTDERTLTDDLCDMFYVWAEQSSGASAIPSFSGPASERDLLNALPDRLFKVTITKTTQQEEAAVGADLGVRLETPLGVKRALLQAKVYDPKDDRLRCDSPQEWDSLWAQLVLMRDRNPLAFLLVYVPAAKLNWADQGIATWEQGYRVEERTGTSSKFGATLIPVDRLLDSANNWLFYQPVRHVGDGCFCPEGISLAKLLIEMLLCRRGEWLTGWQFGLKGAGPQHENSYPVHYVPYREIAISFDDMTPQEWTGFVDTLSAALEGVDIT